MPLLVCLSFLDLPSNFISSTHSARRTHLYLHSIVIIIVRRQKWASCYFYSEHAIVAGESVARTLTPHRYFAKQWTAFFSVASSLCHWGKAVRSHNSTHNNVSPLLRPQRGKKKNVIACYVFVYCTVRVCALGCGSVYLRIVYVIDIISFYYFVVCECDGWRRRCEPLEFAVWIRN